MFPSKNEWKMASEICEKLALFSRTSDAFRGKTILPQTCILKKFVKLNLH